MNPRPFLGFILLLLELILAPLLASAVEDPLPKGPFPLGSSDYFEVRTIRELRPGLTHIHINRGPTRSVPRLTFRSRQQTRIGRDEMLASLEQAGYSVRETIERETPDSQPIYELTAGQFSSLLELKQAAKKVSLPIQFTTLPDVPEEDAFRSVVLDIVVLEPKVYKGKLIADWSRKPWRSSPAEMAAKHNAVVATNGSFFIYVHDNIVGVPNGISIVDGMWHHEHYPAHEKAAILFFENHGDGGVELSIGYDSPPLPELRWGEGESVRLDGIDRMPRENEIVVIHDQLVGELYTHHHISKDISVGTIQEVSSGEHYYIMATGDKKAVLADAQLAASSPYPMTLDLSVPGRPGLNALYTVPALIVDGKPGPVWGQGRGSRTAMGADAEGKIYLVVAQKSSAEYDSVGASLAELRDVGQYLGLVNFGNLDGGGGSTSMVIEGRVLDSPNTEIYEEDRRVSESVLIIDDN